MSKRTHRDKSISTESFDSDLVVIRPKKRLSREIPATVQAQPGNSGEDAGSESFDSDTIVVRPKEASFYRTIRQRSSSAWEL